MKIKIDPINLLYLVVYGFFLIFLILYVANHSITNLVLTADDKWEVIFNICVWFTLTIFSLNGFWDALDKIIGKKNEK